MLRNEAVDRSATSYPLWEEEPKTNPVELPWSPAGQFGADSVRDLLASARTVVIAGSNAALVDAVIANLRPEMRAYWYGSATAESDRTVVTRLSSTCDRIVARLGFELPADWIVVDEGRAGVLLIGNAGEPRRWAIPLETSLASSLFLAFRTLFWFHSRREGLPDAARNFAFRQPLPSPFADPGPDIALAAGRLVFGKLLPDPVPDAEIRIVPEGSAPGRAGLVVLRPTPGSFGTARSLVAAGTRVVWTDTGLPKATISRHRFVLDLVQDPIGIQLEWGTGTAVDVLHRVEKACSAPSRSFHLNRSLRDISGRVLLEGANQAASVQAEQRIDLPDVLASLESFEQVKPTTLPTPDPLSRRVTYNWRAVPATVPPAAGKAEIVRRWTAVDEWAARSISVLQQRLIGMEGEERTILDRVKSFLRGQDAVQRERARLRAELTEIAEQPLSQHADAGTAAAQLTTAALAVAALIQQAQLARQEAEDKADETQQRTAWETRVASAKASVEGRRNELTVLEARENTAAATVQSAEEALAARAHALKAERTNSITTALANDERQLDKLRAELAELDSQHGGAAPKEKRKPFNVEIERVNQQIATAKRDLAAPDRWVPPASSTAGESVAVRTAKDAREAARKARSSAADGLPALEQAAREAFAFRKGPSQPQASAPDIGAAPSIPKEAPPELGELFEYQSQRYLAVKTWEQFAKAGRVALRLNAELVAFPNPTK